MVLASINFCLLCIYALSPRFAVIKCICFGMDQWVTLAHQHLHHILLSIYTSPLFLLCKLTLSFPPFSLHARSSFPFLFLQLLFFFFASRVFEPAYHTKHRSFSENTISSLNGQRAFSALLSKSRDLNKQVLQGTMHCVLFHLLLMRRALIYILKFPLPLNSN